ncbi:MAG: ketoacyl-ACP synthase III [Oscillospiraceae bacterium]|nr:ketoacyl-ACP synthase III [Oscillospiraceae bacterium]MCI9526857.1 ketoacyl-ACP synthase III [Lachnospiraceae bacterium]
MSRFLLQDISIEGVACAVPAQTVDTTEFYGQFGKDAVDSFIQMTGVKSTHRTPEEQTASDLCYVAARELIRGKGIDADTIGALVFISQTPDYRLPATAAVLHKRLGLQKNCMAFDVNLGCSGFVYGLNIVGSLMQTSNMQNALLLFGDTSIKTTSPEDKSSIMLFGEAGSATLLSRKAGKVITGDLKTDGSGFKAIIMPSGAYRNRNGSTQRIEWGEGIIRSDFEGYMNGTDVFSFTISEVPSQIKKFMEEQGTNPDSYDGLVMHQANLLILKQISKKTKFSMDKIPLSIDRYGNTSGTSIPLTLCDAYARTNGDPLHLLLSGFGIGLSWGVVDVIIDTENILPIIVTDEYYTEGALTRD